MLIYWILFAFPAVMAMVSPLRREPGVPSPGQALAMLAFLLFYILVATLRFETGGDWNTYEEMFESVRGGGLATALFETDPGFGLLLWLSAQMELGIYLANGVCAALLGYGVLRIAMSTREGWLGVVAAVPYLLIVVGMGYVRQAGAIGMILLAIAALDRGRPIRVIVYLALAAGLHSTAAIVLPLFGYAMSGRNKQIGLVLSVLGAVGLLFILAGRYEEFEVGYIEAEYSSGGAAVRIVMNLVPALLFMMRRRMLELNERMLALWTLVALASIAAAIGLVVSPSSTAVDRTGLYFSIIQIFGFGHIRTLVPFSERSAFFVRILVIGLAATIQAVWLVFATHSEFWVPYESVLQFL